MPLTLRPSRVLVPLLLLPVLGCLFVYFCVLAVLLSQEQVSHRNRCGRFSLLVRLRVILIEVHDDSKQIYCDSNRALMFALMLLF